MDNNPLSDSKKLIVLYLLDRSYVLGSLLSKAETYAALCKDTQKV